MTPAGGGLIVALLEFVRGLVDLVKSDLRLQARLNEIDRQLASHRFRIGGLKWLGFPVMAGIVLYVTYFLHGRDVGTMESLVTAAAGLAASFAGLGSIYRVTQRQIEELEAERTELEPRVSDSG